MPFLHIKNAHNSSILESEYYLKHTKILHLFSAVELGETCRKVVDNSCAPEHSHCDATTEKCVCDSTHYDSNENEANGTCILSRSNLLYLLVILIGRKES